MAWFGSMLVFEVGQIYCEECPATYGSKVSLEISSYTLKAFLRRYTSSKKGRPILRASRDSVIQVGFQIFGEVLARMDVDHFYHAFAFLGVDDSWKLRQSNIHLVGRKDW